MLTLMIVAMRSSNLTAMKNMIDKTALAEQEKIESAIVQAKATIQTAQDTIIDIHREELLGTIQRAEAARQIRQQNTIIEDTEKSLGKMLKSSIAVIESAQHDYSFVAHAKQVGSQAVSLAKSGKIVSEKEKRLARRKIKRLKEQQELLSKDYEDAIDTARSAKARERLKNRYEKIEAELNKKIYKQQIIAGQAMSPAMSSFWSVVGVGALIAGKYFLGGKDVVSTKPSVPASPPQPLSVSSTQQTRVSEGPLLSVLPVESQTPPASVSTPSTALLPALPVQKSIMPIQSPIGQSVNADSSPAVMPEKQAVMSQAERNTMVKKAIANFGWAALAGAHAIFFAADFAASSVLLSVLNPTVGFAGIAAASGAAGLSKVIQLMGEKEKTDYLKQPNPSFAR